MARRRITRRRMSRASPVRRIARRTRSTGNSGLKQTIMTGAIYGAIRQPMDTYLVSKVAPYLQNYVGDYALPIARAGILYFAGRQFPKVRNVANLGIAIETAGVSANLTSGLLGNNTQSNGGVIIHS